MFEIASRDTPQAIAHQRLHLNSPLAGRDLDETIRLKLEEEGWIEPSEELLFLDSASDRRIGYNLLSEAISAGARAYDLRSQEIQDEMGLYDERLRNIETANRFRAEIRKQRGTSTKAVEIKFNTPELRELIEEMRRLLPDLTLPTDNELEKWKPSPEALNQLDLDITRELEHWFSGKIQFSMMIIRQAHEESMRLILILFRISENGQEEIKIIIQNFHTR